MRYLHRSGMGRAVETAASRWNASGARVRLERTRSPAAADVVIAVDDERLLATCGPDCLG